MIFFAKLVKRSVFCYDVSMKQIFLLCALLFFFSVDGWTKNSPSVLDQIETAMLQKNFHQVETLASELSSSERADSAEKLKALYYLALSDLHFGRYSEAQAMFLHLIEDEGLDPVWRDRAYLGLYNAFFLNYEYDQALSVLETLLEVSPQSELLSMVHLKIARAHFKLTNWSKAREHLQIVMKDFPRSLEVHGARQFLNEKQYFAVQVGSFQSKERAAFLVMELSQKGEYAYIVETSDPRGQIFYRVRVGQLAKLREAEQLRVKLSEQGYPALVYP
jgi:tetratricopeptide (TPR) repeat protein